MSEQPRRAGHKLDASSPLDQLAGVVDVGYPIARVFRLGVAGAGFLEAADRHTFLAGGLPDLVEQIVDCLVARGRDADAPATADEIDDDPRPRPRLAGARRPLDEEVALIERGGSLALLMKVGRLDRPAEAAGEPRPRPGEDVLERAVSAVAGKHGGAEACEGVTLRVRLDRPRRDQRRREWNGLEALASSKDERARRLVNLHDSSSVLSRCWIDRQIAGAQLVLLRRKAEAVLQRILHPSRRFHGLQPANRLAVLDQLVKRHLAAREEPPPCGPSLAPVVLQQLGGQPPRRAFAGARE